ncbi:hypothetical protein FVR03_01350 [Pontibacter qinzhouensis]|uniref:Phage tail protein n=1 Tax=Pontibacter qinzhouensis TaxID=2603253 RepID=A0A5C8KDA1_9BACT|nr:hypothetical protein [Pontibacter qinzhouensis]TXK52390.1 hypothetical protein FVR03_01350 [Pontibacter qinzhouensis]
MAANDIIYGIEKLEFAPAYDDIANAPASGDWRWVENLAEGSVSYVNNEDTSTPFIPEDKTVPIFTAKTPGDPDTFNFALLEFSQQNFADLFDVDYDAATSTTTVMADRKQASLAIRITTRPANGAKKVITYPNTSVSSTLENPFTKDGLVQIAAVADILAFKLADGRDAKFIMQKVTAEGATIDSTPAG